MVLQRTQKTAPLSFSLGGAKVMTDMLNKNIFLIKLFDIDRELESDANQAIQGYYSQAKYENGRFKHPKFQEVSNVWVKLINNKKKVFCEEISRISGASGKKLNQEEFSALAEDINSIFSQDLYLNRLDKFINGIERTAARYGLKLERSKTDEKLALAIYECGIKNNIRVSLSASIAELQLHCDGSDTGRFINGYKAVISLLIVLEIAIFLFMVFSGWRWIVNPNGNFEPKLAFAGIILGIFELIRRYIPKKSIT